MSVPHTLTAEKNERRRPGTSPASEHGPGGGALPAALRGPWGPRVRPALFVLSFLRAGNAHEGRSRTHLGARAAGMPGRAKALILGEAVGPGGGGVSRYLLAPHGRPPCLSQALPGSLRSPGAERVNLAGQVALLAVKIHSCMRSTTDCEM